MSAWPRLARFCQALQDSQSVGRGFEPRPPHLKRPDRISILPGGRWLGAGQPASGGHLAILHHTDCGVRRLASYPEQLAAFFEIPVADLGSKAVEDPYASVRIDVEIARRRLPALFVSGLVYDVDTGLIEVVVPATAEQRRV